MSNSNPAWTPPAPSPKEYPLPIPPREKMPATPAAGAGAPHALRPDASAPASTAFNMDSTNATAAVWPCAGGNSISLSDVPARQIAGPAEKTWADSIARGPAVTAALDALISPQSPNYRGPKFDPFAPTVHPLDRK